MRISVREDDPDFHPDAVKGRVFLNGVLVNDCITADDEKGELLVYKIDETGTPIWPNWQDQPETEIVRGVVKIELPTSS